MYVLTNHQGIRHQRRQPDEQSAIPTPDIHHLDVLDEVPVPGDVRVVGIGVHEGGEVRCPVHVRRADGTVFIQEETFCQFIFD